MDPNLHVTHQINEAHPPPSTKGEDSLLIMLTRPTEGVQGCRNHHGESACGSREETKLCPADDAKDTESRLGSADERQEENACKPKVLEILRELRAFHSDKLTAWREAVKECAFMLMKAPQRSHKQQHSSSADMKVCQTWPRSSTLLDIFLSIGDDIENVTDKVSKIMTKLDAAVFQLSTDKASAVATELQESRDASVQPDHVRRHQLESDPQAKDEGAQSLTGASPDAEEACEKILSNCSQMEDGAEEMQVKPHVSGVLGQPIPSKNDLLAQMEEDREKINDKKEAEEKREWIAVGQVGQLEGDLSDEADQCFIGTPAGAAKGLRCEAADTLSCLIVSGSEELLSRVIHIKVEDGASLQFPVTVGVPFQVQHRSSYRDVAVKIVNDDRRVSYTTPLTTDGVYRGQKGSLAEVKVYSLGLFAVVSCLRRENYIIPKKGLFLKLPMDPRICLNYLPGSFTAPVMAQTMIQPVDAVLLAAVKSRNDLFKSVVSASPLLCLTHPTSQPLRRPLTVTLPCPPNPERRGNTRGPGHKDHQWRPVSVSLLPSDRIRIPGATVKSNELSNESLVILGSQDKQWGVVNKVSVRNQQNGLVSFDLLENFDRLLVVRLLSPLQPCHLTSLAEELEEAVYCHAVTILLQRRQDDPHTVLVAALPSRDLSWELSRLRNQGLEPALLEISSEICMHEADQLFLRFSGNISSTAFSQLNQHERLTFHSQRKNHLQVHLTEVDPFGNYSSPHYKGMLLFYRVTRGQLEWEGDEAVLKDPKLLRDPICKLAVTLPKKVRRIHRPIQARVKLCDQTAESLSDDLLFWLSEELSQKETALLVSSLCLRRSVAQMVKLRAGDSPTAQTFHILAMWRRALPAIQQQPKASQLAQCLSQSGRPDLARVVLLRQAELAEMRKLKK